MICLRKRSLIVAIFVMTTCAVQLTKAAGPPADLCSLLPADEVSKTLGKTYDAPRKGAAPRPYANTAEGTDCHYSAKGSMVLFRAYVDPSPAAAADLFAKLSKFFGAPTPVAGVGDEAYFDEAHALHVRKSNVRFYISLDPVESVANAEKQIKDLAARVIERL
jgi:hypothetical protein